MDIRFKSKRGDYKLEKLILDNELNIVMQDENDMNGILFTKFREHLKRRLYNEYEIDSEMGHTYLCYICREECETDICETCYEKENWIADRLKEDPKTMTKYASLTDRMNKEIESVILFYYPEFRGKEGVFSRSKKNVERAVKSKGKNLVEKYMDDVILEGKKTKFLAEVTIPEKALISQNTLGKAFGDERIKFLEENKWLINTAKVTAVVVFAAIFIGMTYFMR